VFVTIAFSAGYIAGQIKHLMTQGFGLISKNEITSADMMEMGKLSLLVLIKTLGPILLAGMIGAILVGFLQVGAMFTSEPLKPKFEKLNPIEGFKNMFKMVTFIELIKNLVKLALVIYLAYYTISDFMEEILLSSRVTVIESVSMTGEIVYSFFIKVAMVFVVISFFDMMVQRWNYAKKHRMSKDEVKREYKQDEGDPQIKGERRRIHREMVFGDVKKNVKNADAVVSNPIHVAVAISYDSEEMGAPEVVAKGQRKYADMILQIAREENVPIIRNIPLAWSLLQVDEGDAIPEDLYEPVAEVLSLIYEMREQGEMRVEEEAVSEEAKPSTFNPL